MSSERQHWNCHLRPGAVGFTTNFTDRHKMPDALMTSWVKFQPTNGLLAPCKQQRVFSVSSQFLANLNCHLQVSWFSDLVSGCSLINSERISHSLEFSPKQNTRNIQRGTHTFRTSANPYLVSFPVKTVSVDDLERHKRVKTTWELMSC